MVGDLCKDSDTNIGGVISCRKKLKEKFWIKKKRFDGKIWRNNFRSIFSEIFLVKFW